MNIVPSPAAPVSPFSDWIATDLDGTLFSRGWKADDAAPATWHGAPDNPAALAPSSWIPGRRLRLLTGLAAQFPVIAVTARHTFGFRQVDIAGLPFRDGAVVANGAVILRPGSLAPCPEWNARVEPILRDWAGALGEAYAFFRDWPGSVVKPRFLPSETRWPAYLVGKSEMGFWKTAEGQEIRASLPLPAGCEITDMGRELQILPPGISKRIGVRGFAEQFCGGRLPLLGLGDLPGDFPFMLDSEFIACPANSVLSGHLAAFLENSTDRTMKKE